MTRIERSIFIDRPIVEIFEVTHHLLEAGGPS
jgi:hypothetical protein